MSSSPTTPFNCPLVPIWHNLTILHQQAFPFLPPIEVTLAAIKNWLFAHYYNHPRLEAALQSLHLLNTFPSPAFLHQHHINPADILRLTWSLVTLRPSVYPLFLEILLELSRETTASHQTNRFLQLAWLLSPLIQLDDSMMANHSLPVQYHDDHRPQQRHSYTKPVPLMSIAITSANPANSSTEMTHSHRNKQRPNHHYRPRISKDIRYPPTTRIVLPSARHRFNSKNHHSRPEHIAVTTSLSHADRPSPHHENVPIVSTTQSADITQAFSTEDIDLS